MNLIAWGALPAMVIIVVTAQVLAVDPTPGSVQPHLSVSNDQAALLAPNGSIWSWGGTDSHLVAFLGSSTISAIPLQLGSDRDWRQVAFSDLQVFAIKSNGTLWAWGRLGAASRQRKAQSQTIAPTSLGAASNWVAVSAGVAHGIGLKDDGSLWAWGRNDYGQVGGSVPDRAEPGALSIGYKWSAITAGAFDTFALRQDGTIWAWGLDLAWQGTNNMRQPTLIDANTNWAAIAAGAFHLLGLKTDRTLWILGQNVEAYAAPKVTPRTFAQVGQDRDWSGIWAGDDCYLARKLDGSWWGCWHKRQFAPGWGNTNHSWVPTRLPFSFEPKAVAVGKTTVFLDQSGGLWSWGPRLGVALPSMSATNDLERAVQQVKALLPERFRNMLDRDAPFDLEPKRIWRLPAEPSAPRR